MPTPASIVMHYHGDLLPDLAVQARLDGVGRRIRWMQAIAAILASLGGLTGVWGVFQFVRSAEELGQLGSYLAGTTGTLWSAAALALIYVAFLGQERQSINQEEGLRLNRLDLQQTQEELRGQKEQLAAQSLTQRVQRFESTFFQMLNLHHQIVNHIDRAVTRGGFTALVSGTPATHEVQRHGRDVFVDLYKTLVREYRHVKDKGGEPSLDYVVGTIYEQLYQTNQSDLGHYFRNLYTLVKLVKAADIGDKATYTNIVRAQLSSHELLLLFYNGLSARGRMKFKPLIEEYRLLKNMPVDLLLAPSHREGYASIASTPPALSEKAMPEVRGGADRK